MKKLLFLLTLITLHTCTNTSDQLQVTHQIFNPNTYPNSYAEQTQEDTAMNLDNFFLGHEDTQRLSTLEAILGLNASTQPLSRSYLDDYNTSVRRSSPIDSFIGEMLNIVNTNTEYQREQHSNKDNASNPQGFQNPIPTLPSPEPTIPMNIDDIVTNLSKHRPTEEWLDVQLNEQELMNIPYGLTLLTGKEIE